MSQLSPRICGDEESAGATGSRTCPGAQARGLVERMQKSTGPPWLTAAAGSPWLLLAHQDLQRSGLGVTLGWQVNQKASHYDTEVMFLSARPELGLPPPSRLSLPAGDKLSSALLPAKLESTRVMGGYRNAEALMGHRLHGRGATPKPPITGELQGQREPSSRHSCGEAGPNPGQVASWPVLCFMGLFSSLS